MNDNRNLLQSLQASLAVTPAKDKAMSQHARASMPRNREVAIAVDDFMLRGSLVWSPTAHDYEVCEVYLDQQGKCLAVDNPEKLGAMHGGEFKSFDALLRHEAEDR